MQIRGAGIKGEEAKVDRVIVKTEQKTVNNGEGIRYTVEGKN